MMGADQHVARSLQAAVGNLEAAGKEPDMDRATPVSPRHASLRTNATEPRPFDRVVESVQPFDKRFERGIAVTEKAMMLHGERRLAHEEIESELGELVRIMPA